MQKVLESQPAVKKDRAGKLALGNSFLGLRVVSRLGVQGRLKNRVGGRGWGEMARGGGGSGPRSGADLETPAREFFFACCLHFVCICSTFLLFFGFFREFPRLGVNFFFAFPRLGVIFWHFFRMSQTGRHFLHFFAFPILDRGCHLHGLPDPYSENDKKMNNARK